MIYPVSYQHAVWAASASHSSRHYHDGIGYWQASPIQECYRKFGWAEALYMARRTATVVFLPKWLRIAVELPKLPARMWAGLKGMVS